MKWIATEYDNQLNPQSYYTVGSEQFGDFDGPIVNVKGLVISN